MKRVPWAGAISRPLQYDGGTTWMVMTLMMVMMMVMMTLMIMMNVLGFVAFFHVDLKERSRS